MDPRGLRTRLTGAGCTSCGAAIPPERIAVLADRGDVAFVELHCAACGSRTMSVVLAATGADTSPVLDTADDPGVGPGPAAHPASRPPLDDADVLAMHRFLADWDGDLRTLVDPGPDGGAAR